MDKNAEYIFSKYIEAANLLDKKGGWLGNILTGLVSPGLAFINFSKSIIEAGAEKLLGADANFEASVSTIIDKLNYSTPKAEASQTAQWFTIVNNSISLLKNNLKKISAKNINTNIKSEDDLRKSVRQFFVIKNSINEILKTFDYLMSEDVQKIYKQEVEGLYEKYKSYTTISGSSYEQIASYIAIARKQAKEYHDKLDQIINKLKEQYINSAKTKEEEKTKDDTEQKVEEFIADVKR